MKIKNIVFFLGIFLIPSLTLGGVDEELARYIETFKLKPVEKIKRANPKLFWAGKWIFQSKSMSGNRNISCRDCHNPLKGSSDGIALSLGQGSLNTDRSRSQAEGALIPRHSPSLFNLGDPEFKKMFWDGRVSLNKGVFTTPEPRLNGEKPEALHITKPMKTALDAQAIFPLLSHAEMRGAPGSNPVADETDNLKAWGLLVERIKNENPEIYEYLQASFPGEEINIGHVGRALGHFIALRFQVWNTPYDRYLKGERLALDEQSKRGMKIFFTKGRCGNCHWGKHLTNHAFMSVGVPVILGEGAKVDRGLMDLTGNPRHAFRFKNPGLRNVSKSAPYMHNGTFESLDEVIEHYDSLKDSLYKYEVSRSAQAPYRTRIRKSSAVLDEVYSTVFQPFLRRGLKLTSQEKEDLKAFLVRGLSD